MTLPPVNNAKFSLPLDNGHSHGPDWDEVTSWFASRIGAHRSVPDHLSFNMLVLVGSLTGDKAFQERDDCKALRDDVWKEARIVVTEKMESKDEL